MSAHLPHNLDSTSILALDEATSRNRPTPQTTIEAIMYCVRERGLEALKEPKNIERLLRCDEDTRAQINNRIARLIEQKRLPR